MNTLQNLSFTKFINSTKFIRSIKSFFKYQKEDRFEIELKVSNHTAFTGSVKLNKKKNTAHIEYFKVHRYFRGRGLEALVLKLIEEHVMRLNRYVASDDKIVRYITTNASKLDKRLLETLYDSEFNIWSEETALLNIPFKQPDLEEEKTFKLCLIKIL